MRPSTEAGRKFYEHHSQGRSLEYRQALANDILAIELEARAALVAGFRAEAGAEAEAVTYAAESSEPDL